ncbi:hypothetical protein JCM5350_007848 [Sporobolomyces pararoseus]
MPVHIPDFPSASPVDAVSSTSTTTSTSTLDSSASPAQTHANTDVLPDLSPSYSSPLIDEKFIDPTSSQGIWIRIKGYTNHLSPVGKRYAREQFSLERVGIQADHYRETLLKDTGSSSSDDTTEGARTTGLILKVEALKGGKVLAVVNSRLTKEEEEVYYTFVRGQESEQSVEPETGGGRGRSDDSPANEEELYDQLSRTTRQTSSIRRMRYPLPTRDDYLAAADPYRWSAAQYSRSGASSSNWPHGNHEEEEEDEEDYADLPPLVEADWVPPNLATATVGESRTVEEEMTAEGEERVEGRSLPEEHVWRIASTRELMEESSARYARGNGRRSALSKSASVERSDPVVGDQKTIATPSSLSSLFSIQAPFSPPFNILNSPSRRNTLTTSSKMLSRSTTVSSASSTESKSMFRRFFSLRRSESTSTSERESLVAKEEPEVDLFAQIMALNARHGHPSVQAHSCKARPVEKKSKTSKRSTSSSKVASIPSGPPPAYDTFEAIMRINAQHGHPSVQAAFVR